MLAKKKKRSSLFAESINARIFVSSMYFQPSLIFVSSYNHFMARLESIRLGWNKIFARKRSSLLCPRGNDEEEKFNKDVTRLPFFLFRITTGGSWE